jgi:hypothetical protein
MQLSDILMHGPVEGQYLVAMLTQAGKSRQFRVFN